MGKHPGATDSSVLQRMPSAANIRELDAKQISAVTEDTENTFLGAIESSTNDKKVVVMSTIKLNKIKVTFKGHKGRSNCNISRNIPRTWNCSITQSNNNTLWPS